LLLIVVRARTDVNPKKSKIFNHNVKEGRGAMIGRNYCKNFLNPTQKVRLKIPFRKEKMKIFLSIMTPMTMFTQNQNRLCIWSKVQAKILINPLTS